jgi:DNA-binding transcriptional LysR family regulator
LTMIEAGEGISLLPACIQHLHSRDVVFKALRNRGCEIEVILAWRADSPDAIREGFLNLLRGSRSEIERLLKHR